MVFFMNAIINNSFFKVIAYLVLVNISDDTGTIRAKTGINKHLEIHRDLYSHGNEHECPSAHARSRARAY